MFFQFQYNVRRFVTDRIVLTALIVGGLLQLLMWGYILLHYDVLLSGVAIEQSATNLASHNQLTTFLHYTVGIGVDYVGEPRDIFTLPIVGLILLLANTLLAYVLHAKAVYTSYVLLGISDFLHIFLLIATMLVISLNL